MRTRWLALVVVMVAMALPMTVQARSSASDFTVVATMITSGSDRFVTLQAHTRIGATCALTELNLDTGHSRGIGKAMKAGNTGIIRWSWREEGTVAGATATVKCTWKGQVTQGTVTVAHAFAPQPTPANTSQGTYLTCATLGFAITIPNGWASIKRCMDGMPMGKPDASIVLSLGVTPQSQWDLSLAQTEIDAYLSSDAPNTFNGSIVNGPTTSTINLNGRNFAEGEETLVTSDANELVAVLQGWKSGRLYTITTIVKLTGDSDTDTTDKIFAVGIWDSIKLL